MIKKIIDFYGKYLKAITNTILLAVVLLVGVQRCQQDHESYVNTEAKLNEVIEGNAYLKGYDAGYNDALLHESLKEE